MKLAFFKTLWGNTLPIAKAAEQAVHAGFSGLEGPCPTSGEARKAFIDTLTAHGLEYIAEISTTGFAVPEPGASVQDHLDAFERILDHSLPANPIFFTAMAGNDLWTTKQSLEFLRKAKDIADGHGVRVGFETHRSRSLFHPRVASELLGELPDLEITVDFSHWCNVCERLVLDEAPHILDLCATRALHIQPRVGYDQGAQVPDPTRPLYRNPLESHLRWWRTVIDGQQRRGFHRATFTPEFGPDGYQQILATTGEAHGDLWEFNQWIAATIRKQFDT
jgi:sugar phosphate isomerase/epimerase